jgi:Family of unknown function (DUF6152)
MRFTSGLVVIGLMVLALPARAHHSHGLYEDAFTDIQGVVKEIHFLAPHSFVYIEVKPAKGDPQVWALEGTSRQGLEKIGVTKEYVKIGDTIKARCHVLRDKSTGCLLGYVKAKDGTVKDWDGGQLAPPADF